MVRTAPDEFNVRKPCARSPRTSHERTGPRTEFERRGALPSAHKETVYLSSAEKSIASWTLFWCLWIYIRNLGERKRIQELRRRVCAGCVLAAEQPFGMQPGARQLVVGLPMDDTSVTRRYHETTITATITVHQTGKTSGIQWSQIEIVHRSVWCHRKRVVVHGSL